MSGEAALEKLARFLRVKPEVLTGLESQMVRFTSRNNVLDSLVSQNQVLSSRVLSELGLRNPSADEVYDALIKKLVSSDRELFNFLGQPNLADPNSCLGFCQAAFDLADVKEGFFLKEEKAWQMLENFSPQNILDFLGYKDIFELRAKESLWEIFPALRFMEPGDWMNNVFLKSYESLSPGDFERRRVKIEVLSGKWLPAAEKFLQKKHHNVSHLKELGVIFIVPIPIDSSGETLRIFSLLLHYLHEVPFYSDLFGKYAGTDGSFSHNLTSLLRGDVISGPLPEAGPDTFNIRIVQRYLAKDNENDERLFEPHINPEASHWELAERDIAKFSALNPDLGLSFWSGLNWVGDFFASERNGEVLISMNLIDSVMSLVKQKEMIKYLYHHQEALWNQIFISYLGEERFNNLVAENINRGYITLNVAGNF